MCNGNITEHVMGIEYDNGNITEHIMGIEYVQWEYYRTRHGNTICSYNGNITEHVMGIE